MGQANSRIHTSAVDTKRQSANTPGQASSTWGLQHVGCNRKRHQYVRFTTRGIYTNNRTGHNTSGLKHEMPTRIAVEQDRNNAGSQHETSKHTTGQDSTESGLQSRDVSTSNTTGRQYVGLTTWDINTSRNKTGEKYVNFSNTRCQHARQWNNRIQAYAGFPRISWADWRQRAQRRTHR